MTAMTRRSLLLATIALPAAAALLTPPATAAVDPQRAASFINAAGNEMVTAVNDPRLDLPTRRARVAAILRRVVDVEGTGRFILGRYARQATPAEMQEYMRLFDEMIIRNLSARFGQYRGVRFAMGRSQQRMEDDVLVSTVIEPPNMAAFGMDWRVADVGGQPKVVDVIAEGTSMRLTQRSEYAAVIQRNGGRIAPLLDAMRNQIAQLAAREGRG